MNNLYCLLLLFVTSTGGRQSHSFFFPILHIVALNLKPKKLQEEEVKSVILLCSKYRNAFISSKISKLLSLALNEQAMRTFEY